MRALLALGVVSLLSGFEASPAAEPARAVDDLYHAVTTMRDLNSLGIAVEAYYTDHRTYPEAKNGEDLVRTLEPSYAAHLASADAWGNAIRYVRTPDGQDYLLVSAGSDGRFEEASWRTEGEFLDSKADSVFSGHFTRKWVVAFP